MKKTLFSLVFFFFVSFCINEIKAQDFWQQLNGPYGGHVLKILSAPNGSLYALSGSAVYRSANEGQSWTQVTPSSIKDITTGCVAPNGFIYIGIGNFQSKVYRSTNEGATWELRVPDGGYDFSDMTATPSGVILAGTSYMFSFHGQFIQSGEIHRSVDNGNSFTISPFPDLAIRSISTNTNGDVYVATLNGLFRSNNGGASWGILRNDTCGKVFTSSLGHIFFTSRGNVLRSVNNAGSWDNVSKMPMASNAAGDLFTAEGGNIFKSTNNGSNWIQISSISNAPLFDVYSILPAGAGKLFTASDLGVFKSVNNGINWNEANNGIRIPNVKTIISRGNTIFAGSERYISRSTDNGSSWINLINGLPETGPRTLILSPNSTLFAYILGSGIFRSLNNGDSWSKLSNLPAGVNSGMMAINLNSEIFATGSGKIYKSVDNGNNWVEAVMGLPSDTTIDYYGLSVDPQNNLYVSARWGGFNTQYGLFKLTNGGASWVLISSDQPPGILKFNSQGHIWGLLGITLMRSTNGGVNFQPVSSAPSYVIDFEVGNQDHVFIHYVENEVYSVKRSLDNGGSWTEYITGLGQLLVYDLEFDDNNRLLAGTQSGLFRTTTSTVGVLQNSQIASGFSLSQNYPNPFNPETSIRFLIPENSHTMLTVYNSIGEELAVLVNDNLIAGTYEYSWNAGNFASGIYFYKLTAGKFTSVKKMILVK